MKEFTKNRPCGAKKRCFYLDRASICVKIQKISTVNIIWTELLFGPSLYLGTDLMKNQYFWGVISK